MRRSIRVRITSWSSLLVSCFAIWFVCSTNVDVSFGQEDLQSRIGVLIRQLADPSYSKRQSAKLELERIGIVALDQLHAASFDPDPQIASTARFIVQSNQFAWSWDFDSPNVKDILENFSNSDVDSRSVYIDELALLDRDEGLPALCRLARYETVGPLAKRAAILILTNASNSDPELRKSRAAKVLRWIDGGESVASQWVHKYYTDAVLDWPWWRSQLASESKSVAAKDGDSSRGVVQQLTKWLVQQLAALPDSRSTAIEVGETLLKSDTNSLSPIAQAGQLATQAFENATWALKLKLPELVQKQHQMLPYRLLSREPMFTYCLAESYLLAGNRELSERIAEEAFRQVPIDWLGQKLEEPKEKASTSIESLFGQRSMAESTKRFVIGGQLQNRGQFEWAIRELKKAAEGNDFTLAATMGAVKQIAQIHYSFERFAAAREALAPFIRRFENEPMFRSQIQEDASLDAASFYYLAAGEEARVQGDIETAFSFYRKSMEVNEQSVDAVIGMYQLNLPPEKLKVRREYHRQAVLRARELISRYENYLKVGGNKQMERVLNMQLAQYLNSLAWLLAKTEGDLDEALFLSRRACSIDQNRAEYLDTLAQCYFSAGKWSEAVEQQRKAVALVPYMPEFKRALEKFEAKLAEVLAKKAP